MNEKQKIDLIFGYFSGEIIDESTLIYFKEKGVPIINLSLNDRELLSEELKMVRHKELGIFASMFRFPGQVLSQQ